MNVKLVFNLEVREQFYKDVELCIRQGYFVKYNTWRYNKTTPAYNRISFTCKITSPTYNRTIYIL